MGKSLFIAEKPSVAQEFARVLSVNGRRMDGYMESEDAVVTWCVGHLVTMSYPEKYDENLKRWRMETLPFIPEEGQWKYEIIDNVKKQFTTVKTLLNREDVTTIYVCTDSGREGEYIYRLVREMAGVKNKDERRVWIDSQTEEEIKRGVREAKPLSAYDNLSSSAYLRAKEDYLMGINFSRALTLKFGQVLSEGLQAAKREVISVGRVMTCVLGMVVRREREIRAFVPTPFYRVAGTFRKGDFSFEGEWRAVQGSKYFESPLLYKENGFKKRETAEELIAFLNASSAKKGEVLKLEKKTEKKGAPLLFNLAEAQNECSKRFKIGPDETLSVIQELYEKKLVTYPRTDARVLSSAVAKVIRNNLYGLSKEPTLAPFANEVLSGTRWQSIGKSPYVDDGKITDHYAIIPTGQGLSNLSSLSPLKKAVYELIARRFLAIFYPPSVHEKVSLELLAAGEHFFASFRFLKEEGYLKVYPASRKKSGNAPENAGTAAGKQKNGDEKDGEKNEGAETSEEEDDLDVLKALETLKKGDFADLTGLTVKEGVTTPPKRYTSGSLILAMENAGQLIEDESLRQEIRGSGIGTSATRAEIVKKLTTIDYIAIHKKTQAVTPRLKGELVYDIVDASMKQLLNPDLTASWEKGLSGVSDGSISSGEYMEKLSQFVTRRTENVKGIENPAAIKARFNAVYPFYKR